MKSASCETENTIANFESRNTTPNFYDFACNVFAEATKSGELAAVSFGKDARASFSLETYFKNSCSRYTPKEDIFWSPKTYIVGYVIQVKRTLPLAWMAQSTGLIATAPLLMRISFSPGEV